MPQKTHNGIGTKKISAAQGLQPSLAADLEMGTFYYQAAEQPDKHGKGACMPDSSAAAVREVSGS